MEVQFPTRRFRENRNDDEDGDGCNLWDEMNSIFFSCTILMMIAIASRNFIWKFHLIAHRELDSVGRGAWTEQPSSTECNSLQLATLDESIFILQKSCHCELSCHPRSNLSRKHNHHRENWAKKNVKNVYNFFPAVLLLQHDWHRRW